MAMKLRLSCLTILVITIFSCGGEKKIISREVKLNGENNEINPQRLVEDTLMSGHFYSRVDSVDKFGYGWVGDLSKEFLNKELKVLVSGKARIMKDTIGCIVLALDANNVNTFWIGLDIRKYDFKPNTWVNFTEEVNINASLTNALPLKFSIYSFKPNGPGVLEVDDLKVKIESEVVY
jgi:hypothetical protein